MSNFNIKLMICLQIAIIVVVRSNAQSKTKLSTKQIDSVLARPITNGAKTDTLRPFGGYYKSYKKILGINIRVDKGEVYQETILINGQLFNHCENYISESICHTQHRYYEYHFIENQPVKYEETVSNPKKLGQIKLINKTVVYFQADLVIADDSDKKLSAQQKKAILKFALKEQAIIQASIPNSYSKHN